MQNSRSVASITAAKTPLRKAGNNDFDSRLRESQVWRARDFPHDPFGKFCVPLSVERI
jgi:hypothetical protein